MSHWFHELVRQGTANTFNLFMEHAVVICDPQNKETHPALYCENLNIIELGNVSQTHKSNPNCGYRL